MEEVEIRPQPGKQEMFLSTAADIAIFGGAAGGGKALSIDTPIPTPEGWKLMGELTSEDYVFDEQGIQTKVIIAHDIQHNRPCYKLTFSDGESFVCDESHLWVTMDAQDRLKVLRSSESWRSARKAKREKRGTGKRPDLSAMNSSRINVCDPPSATIKTTNEIAGTLKIKTRLNHSIKICAPLNLPEKDLPINPYVFGVWLGDGTTSNGIIPS